MTDQADGLRQIFKKEKLEMTIKHTPGPWHIGRENDHSVDRFRKGCEWARIRSEAGGLVATVESVHPKGKRKSSDFDIEAAIEEELERINEG